MADHLGGGDRAEAGAGLEVDAAGEAVERAGGVHVAGAGRVDEGVDGLGGHGDHVVVGHHDRARAPAGQERRAGTWPRNRSMASSNVADLVERVISASLANSTSTPGVERARGRCRGGGRRRTVSDSVSDTCAPGVAGEVHRRRDGARPGERCPTGSPRRRRSTTRDQRRRRRPPRTAGGDAEVGVHRALRVGRHEDQRPAGRLGVVGRRRRHVEVDADGAEVVAEDLARAGRRAPCR